MVGDNSSESYVISMEIGGIVDGFLGGCFVIDGDICVVGVIVVSGMLLQQNSMIKFNMMDNL